MRISKSVPLLKNLLISNILCLWNFSVSDLKAIENSVTIKIEFPVS